MRRQIMDEFPGEAPQGTVSSIFHGFSRPLLHCFGLALLVSVSSAVSAQAEQAFECEIKSHSQHGWIPPEMRLWYDGKTNEAQVFDGIIQDLYGKPISAKFRQLDANSVQLNWVVKDIKLSNANRKVTAAYSVKLRPDTGKITMKVFLRGSDMLVPSGSGICKPYKVK